MPKRTYTHDDVARRWHRIWLFSAPDRMRLVVHESFWPSLVLSVLPLMTLFGFALFFDAAHWSGAKAGVGIALGVVCWTLVEYALHRFVYHTRHALPFANFIDCLHAYHHHHLDDPRVLNAGPLLAYPTTALCLLPVFLATMSVSWTALVGLGLVSAYGFYEYTHYTIHRREHRRGYFAWVQRYHFFHHRRAWHANYGNTQPVWDLVFGTYRRDWKEFRLGEAELKTL